MKLAPFLAIILGIILIISVLSPQVLFPNLAFAYHSTIEEWTCWDADTDEEWICGTSTCDNHQDRSGPQTPCGPRPPICDEEPVDSCWAETIGHWGPPEEEDCEPNILPSSFSYSYPQQHYSSLQSSNSADADNSDLGSNNNNNNNDDKIMSVGFVQIQLPGSGTRGAGMGTLCEIPSSSPPCPPMTADTFALSSNNKKTSDYNVKRVYLKDGSVHTVPPGVDPATIYPPSEIALVRTHNGVDFSSRDATGTIASIPFEAGVSGTAHIVPGSKYNTVTVTTSDGSSIQYLHTSIILITDGDIVGPDSIIGMTGNISPTSVPIHLHVQAKDPSGKLMDPQALIDKENKAAGIC